MVLIDEKSKVEIYWNMKKQKSVDRGPVVPTLGLHDVGGFD